MEFWFLKNDFIYIFMYIYICVYVCIACIYVLSVHHACPVLEEARRALDALELELQMIVSHNIGAKN